MHTGYDNFWMHKNSRLKPVLNLPKNDNYSHALLTDNHKHMQSGGCPSQLSSFIPPQNNAASSHEKDHYRNGQSMWPSSVYSLPFMPSYPNNLHPREPLFCHTNNFVCSSPKHQAQEKHDFRHLEVSNGNGNVNILTMHNSNTSTPASNGLAHAQISRSTNTQIPRIRVKDVFSLNNKSVQSQLGLDDHFEIGQQKELIGCAAHCSRALESETQTEYFRYKNANLVESSKSSPHFEHNTPKVTGLNNQEQFQNSCSFYQQNDGFSLGNFEFSGGRQMESSLSLENFQSSTPASLLSQLLTQESILQRGSQNCQVNAGGHSNAERRHGGEKVTSMRNLPELHNPDISDPDPDYSRSCELNERAHEDAKNLINVSNVYCDLQENLPKINEVNKKSPNSASNIMAENASSVTSKGSPLKEINNQQNCCLKISIPYTGNSSFIRLNDRDDTERNPAIGLQSFLEQNDKNCAIDRNTHNINDEENGVVNSIPPPVGRSSFISHHAPPESASIHDSSANEGDSSTHKNGAPTDSASLTSSPINHYEDTVHHRLNRQEFDALSKKNADFFHTLTGAPEIIQQKFSVKISREDDNATEQGIPTKDFIVAPVTLKQENFHPEIEIASLQRAQNPPGGKEFHRTIKTEENSENLTARECELGLQPPDEVKLHVEGCSSASKSRSDSAPVTDSEDFVDQVHTLKSTSSKRGDIQESEEKKRGRDDSLSRVNYKSNINRYKLDLLIQFLKKDQDSVGSSSCKERQTCRETVSNTNSDSCRSRRKLNKASIVRNKNNSREMISLMSLKASNFTCKALPFTERSKNLENTEYRKSTCPKGRVVAEESFDLSKECMKFNNPCQENESKKDDSWMAEPSYEASCLNKQQSQESLEKPVPKGKCAARDENAVISTMRAFQNSKTHFCASCNLVSSIESFWVNVVSGEVRCLNCFKIITLKAKGNVLKSKSNDLYDSSMKPPQKGKSKTEKENKTKEVSAALGGSNGRKRSSKCEGALRKLKGTKENVRQELLEMFGSAECKSSERKGTTNYLCHTRRRSSSGEGIESQKGKPSEEKVLTIERSAGSGSSSEELVEKRLSENGTNQGVKNINAKRKRKCNSGEEDFAKRERHSSSITQGKTSEPKKQYSEDDAKKETVIKSEKSHCKRASRSEEGSENRAKKGTTEDSSSNMIRSSDDTGKEFRCHKGSAIEECGQKDLRVTHCTDESRKPAPRESFSAKRSHKHATSDMSKNRNIWREGRNQRRPKASKLFGRRDPYAPNASARSTYSQNGVENQKRVESTEQPRKRKNSDEDFSPRKVHILQDFVKRDSVQTTHPSKSWEAKASKENDNSQRGSLWSARISAGKSGRSDAPKEECVLFREHSRKEAKPPPEGEKAKAKDLWKGLVASRRAKSSAPAKGKANGSVDPPRRKSKDEQRGPQKAYDSRRTSDSEGPRRKSSHEEPAIPKARILTHFNGEGKRESLTAENREKKKSEEKERSRSSEKIPKVSPTTPDVLSTPAKEGQSRRPDGAGSLFREKQSSKAITGAPYEN